LDVTADGSIDPIDVLLVINLLNRFSKPDWLASNGPLSSEDLASFQYYDVNADGSVDPLDVLTIINLLNRREGNGEGEGEGYGEGEFVANPGMAITDKNKLHDRRDNILLMEGSIGKRDDLASLDVALADWGSRDWESAFFNLSDIMNDDEEDDQKGDGLEMLLSGVGDKHKE
jgi:hypothetical protein